jgi:protein-tyrosine kinase
MSNIYEALEQACREKTNSGISPQLALQTGVKRSFKLEAEMALLYHQIEFSLGNSPHKLIQFIGCRRGAGVSTIVREYARNAVERQGKTVLVLDSAYQDPAQKINFNVTCEYGWLDLIEKGELIDKAFFRLGESNLYFAPISIQATLVSPMKDISATVMLWEKLKERFDLILIDSSSDANTLESIALSHKVDGVVLIIDAGKTRRQVVKSIKKKVLSSGGLILGVILNRRRYYVPDYIYTRLPVL